jgi:hypothetical protein
VSGYVWKIGDPHCSLVPEWWRQQACNERAFANEDRRRKFGSVESIRIHEESAARYDAEADRLEAAARVGGEA